MTWVTTVSRVEMVTTPSSRSVALAARTKAATSSATASARSSSSAASSVGVSPPA